MRYLLLLLPLLGCCASVALGQPPKQETRSCRILFLAGPENAPKKVYLNDGVTSQEVELPSLNLSGVYQLAPGNISLKLCTALPTAEQPIPAGVPSVAVGEGVTDCYLLVTSDPKNTVVPLKCQLVNASPAGFHAGQTMWLNLTPYIVGGKIGNKPLNLKPISQFIVDPPREDAGGYAVQIGYDPGQNKKAVMILSTEWLHDPRGRNIVFVMMLPESKIPRIKGFSDIR